jgi:dihydroflavonol-4-reductase
MILVTGATGFLGSELVRQLTAMGCYVRALYRNADKIPASLHNHALVEWLKADILDVSTLEDVLEGISQVYHCAALVSFDPRDKQRLFKANIEGTANIVNLCAVNQIRLLHVSSVAALGEARTGQLITEKNFKEDAAEGHAYSISKYESEMEVWRGIAEGLDAVIINPSVIIGAGAGFTGSGAIFQLVRKGLSYYTKGITGFVDVEDVATAAIELMNSIQSAERFIISSENYSFEQLFKEIALAFKVKAPGREAKPWMLGLAWRAAKLAGWITGKPSKLTKDAASSSLKVSLYSNEKIKNTISIQFKPISQTIAETCAGLNQNQ